MIEDWIAFMKTCVINEAGLLEELYSHAWRLRNPEDFISKFFIHYSKEGNTGKSFFVSCLASIYGQLSNIGATPYQLSGDKFNSWMFESLFIFIEEAQRSDNNNYETKDLEATIKRITTRNGSNRGMQKVCKADEHRAIVGMNCNTSDLYGMIRTRDEALKSRLVITEFKPNQLSKRELNKITKDFIRDPCFGYSLYRYLKDDLDIPEDYCTDRYEGEDKDQFFEKYKLDERNQNNVDIWLIEQYEELKKEEMSVLDIKKVSGVEY
jgi:hypothetical protein